MYFFSKNYIAKNKRNMIKPGINTRVKVKLVKCQNEDPKAIKEEEYMPKCKCNKLNVNREGV